MDFIIPRRVIKDRIPSLSNAWRASNLFAKNRNGWLGGLKIRRGCGNLSYGHIGDKERLIRESGGN